MRAAHPGLTSTDSHKVSRLITIDTSESKRERTQRQVCSASGRALPARVRPYSADRGARRIVHAIRGVVRTRSGSTAVARVSVLT